MRFDLVDTVLERTPGRIVTVKQVTAAEEYLADHFPTFPVLPGVMMIEAMVQAARRLLETERPGTGRHVLGAVRGIKYGGMVRPGDALRVEVTMLSPTDGDTASGVEFKGAGMILARAPGTPGTPGTPGVIAPAGSTIGSAPADAATGEAAAARSAVSGRFTLRPVALGPG